MKFLFWLIVILFVWWAYKRARAGARTADPQQTTPPPQDMVTCRHCGIHLPRDEAVAGTRGQYCCAEHRNAAGDRNPG
jgi:uncharacterized protein